MRQPDFAGAARALQAYQNYRSRLSRMSIEAREAGVQPVLSDDETAGQDRRTASPSVPVESREQPSDDAGGWEIKPEPGELRRYVKAELLDEANATILELRAEVADHEKRWQQRADLITRTSELLHRAAALEAEAEAMPARYLEALKAVTAERDRARDLAAHLEEDSARLREQLEAVRALAADPCLGMGCTANCLEHIDAADVLAILGEEEPGHAQ